MALIQKVEKLFLKTTDNTYVQLFRYGFVGTVAFMVDFGVLYVLTHFGGIHYLISAALAFTVGLTTNYLLSIRWVFNTHIYSKRSLEFAIFAIIGVIGLGLTELIMWWLTGMLGAHYLASKIAATVIVFIWNFGVRKLILFKKE